MLIVALAYSCGQNQQTIKLDFLLREPAGSHTELAFFIYDIFVLDAKGQRHPFELDKNSYPYDLALIQLGSEKANFSISGKSQAKNISELEYTIGVPSSLNHANPLLAQSPLDISSMFWTWQQGYKFFRLDGKYETNSESNTETTTKWAFHLGSSGCVSPSALQAPTKGCEYEHRIKIILKGFDPNKNKVVVDLQNLIAYLPGNDSVNCSANYLQQNICVSMVEKFGLDSSTGKCLNQCRTQTIFKIQ